VVLIHAGNVPGVTSLVAADLLRAHPDADELELAFSISAAGISGRAGEQLRPPLERHGFGFDAR
jgi:hypothetical protein